MTEGVRQLKVAQVGTAAKLLAVVCLLNLNGVGEMALSTGPVFSVLILLLALWLVASHAGSRMPTLVAVYGVLIYTYVALGLLFDDPTEPQSSPVKYIRDYGAGFLIVYAQATHALSLQGTAAWPRYLEFLRNLLFVSACAVLASPLLYPFYVNLPTSFSYRMGGFFANPNEAGMVSLLALAFALVVPARFWLLRYFQVGVALTAIVLTFSKTAISAAVVVLALYMFWKARSSMLWLLAGLFGASLLLLFPPTELLRQALQSGTLDITLDQQRRLLAVLSVMEGQIDSSTTTGRTSLWEIAIDRSLDNFPFGTGLGSAHHIVGGIMERGIWQGAHNTFLMLWAEAGPIPSLMLAGLVAAVWLALARHVDFLLLRLVALALVADLMATHSALGTGYVNLMFGLLLGAAAATTGRLPGHHGRWALAQASSRTGADFRLDGPPDGHPGVNPL